MWKIFSQDSFLSPSSARFFLHLRLSMREQFGTSLSYASESSSIIFSKHWVVSRAFFFVLSSEKRSELFIFPPHSLTYSTINPILYNVMSHRYRIAFRETLCSRKRGFYSSSNGFVRDQSSFRETTIAAAREQGYEGSQLVSTPESSCLQTQDRSTA